MKIIHGHDYYDTAGMGIDPSIVFVRERRELPEPPFYIPIPLARETLVSCFVLIIGGRIFPGVMECRPVTGKRTATGPDSLSARGLFKTLFHYDAESAIKAYARATRDRKTASWFVYRHAVSEERIADHFAMSVTGHQTDWMIRNRVVTGVVFREGRAPASAMVNSPDLAGWEAFRALDPAGTHMAISSWVGGVLPFGTDTVELRDKDRIRKAGFDVETSFRTPRGTKKPRKALKSGE